MSDIMKPHQTRTISCGRSYCNGIKLSFILCLCLYFSFISIDGFSQTYNVKDYGATGKKEVNAQASIQKAIDACAANGGGMVYFPAGEYSSGTIHLKSNIRFNIEAGATLYCIKDGSAYDKKALIYGEDLQNITIEGRGTVNGEAQYEWRLADSGKPLMRSYPKKNQRQDHLIFLLNCKDVRIANLSLIDSPSWTIRPIHCDRMVIDGIYIHTDLKDGVWADGIDPDGCRNLRIANCTVETGDDALVFYSENWYGPAQPCENITVTNCRFTSASSAIKFCDGNRNAIRRVTIDNCVIEGANRGIAFMDFDGGEVSDIVLSNLTVNCIRYDWFWWGEGDPIHFNVIRRNEGSKKPDRKPDPPAGKIFRVLISNVIAIGKGSSMCNGHPESWMQDITLDNVKLYISHDTLAASDKSVYAMKFQYVKNLKLKNVDIFWGTPESSKWESALDLEDINGLELDGVTARQSKIGTNTPAITFSQVENATIKNSSAQIGTGTFMKFTGEKTKDITIYSNNFSRAKIPFTSDASVDVNAIRSEMNINPKK